jgi:phosphopantothenoylcysteine decarboxylase/phosphopantothenate--cysteine ligase
MSRSRKPRRILFQLSGSIACYKACQAVSRLAQEGVEVQAVCTRNALRFVGEATLEGLTGRPVFSDAFERGRLLDHLRLAKQADLAIVCPASANTLCRMAAGLADDAIGGLFLGWDPKAKPYLVAPAMNREMLRHPAVAGALAKLAGWGVQVLPTGTGPQACGDVGPGRLLEPDDIVERIHSALKARR